MYQGFYNLASGMLTQSRNLDVISNNMVNIQTSGYKSDTMVSTTFGEEILYRTGRHSKGEPQELASVSKIKTADRTYVNYNQGAFEQTEGLYDFALQGNGFFCIQTEAGEQYTRNGSFSVDEEGYLCLNDSGRVLGEGDQPIQITSENFSVDGAGLITVTETQYDDDGNAEETQTEELGTLKVVDFADYEALHKEDNGLFSTDQQQIQAVGTAGEGEQGTVIQWKMLERSNVDMVREMTNMMSSQRALQSASQALKMYDQMMGKTSDIGKL